MQIKSTQCVIKSRRAQNLQASDWLIKASYPYVDYLTYCPVFSFLFGVIYICEKEMPKSRMQRAGELEKKKIGEYLYGI